MDLNNGTLFRTSVFAGKGSSTANDEAHRSIFTVSAEKDTAWHQLTVTYSPSGAVYYLDGKQLSITEGEGADALYGCGISSLMTIMESDMPVEYAIANAEKLYYKAAVRLFRDIKNKDRQ